MRRLLQTKIIEPLLAILRAGVTPEKIALSLALGLTLGVFPALGTTTILCLAAALLLRLNLPAIQMANLAAYPMQLILFIPFIRLGELAFGVPVSSLTLAKVAALISANAWLAIHTLWTTTMHAIAVWAVISVPIAIALYFIFASLLRALWRNSVRFGAEPPTSTQLGGAVPSNAAVGGSQ
jgi:uncharacterized protein (DUF2062 family)